MIAKNGRKENECQPKMNFKKTYENICMINWVHCCFFFSRQRKQSYVQSAHLVFFFSKHKRKCTQNNDYDRIANDFISYIPLEMGHIIYITYIIRISFPVFIMLAEVCVYRRTTNSVNFKMANYQLNLVSSFFTKPFGKK